ncbi:NACHT domain-containing protein [Streptomyces bambusae]|uniref:NACHT domain-containing protein n=1 Tax=Streptomyces bambusae TaxID=1550616 RepID=A0ABS6ZAG5_9ACTN|nr:NACHT domain-containing protein [Streptomyces bambusae]MBW5484218.1 NACHT domain-containing protein [Streptomyces bambusae]
MDASVVGVRLASSAMTPLIRKLFRTEGDGAGAVADPIRLSAYVSWREKRALDRSDLDRLAAKLVARALAAPGERPLPQGEEAGVATALGASLHALGDLDMTDVQAVALGPAGFAAALRAKAPYLGLSEDAELFHARLLHTACEQILHFFTQRSTFVPATLVEQSRRGARSEAKVDEVLRRVPRQDGRDAAFEDEYRAYVARRHSTVTIYGLDLEPGTATWPLDTAYVSLELAGAPEGRGPDMGRPRRNVRRQLWAGLALELGVGEHRRGRFLLRGEAGSGKTTLIQHLAVTAAREAAGLVPFVLPLRTLTRHGERLPAPGGFLEAAGSALAGSEPDGWEARVLRDGQALLLVDGIDEIPEAERAGARAWLAELITAYPDNAWLVTSRPSAVRPDWLREEHFAELALAPMSRDHVATFIDRWHAAAGADPELTVLRDQLRQAVRTKPELARLATNPLLCGLICALHRERRGFLPSGRKELYTAALSMLLHRRDKERRLRLPELGDEPQLQLLQRLAYWLIRNGRTEMARDHAVRLIANALPAVPEAQRVLGGAEAVHTHFLERTGLLRAPTEDTVEFVHRTFQDFLGARMALDEGSTGELALHADDDQWEDVVKMAVAQGRPRERAEIIRALLDQPTPRSTLLAVASLEYAAELDPELREEATAAMADLWPPADYEAGRRLGEAAGPLVLDLLPDPAQAPDEETALMALVTAGGTGSDAAIDFLSRYCDHPLERVRDHLTELWPRFETVRFANEVLGRIDPPPDRLKLTSGAELAALPVFAPPPILWISGPVSSSRLTAFAGRYPVEELVLHALPRVGMVELRDCTTLRTLRMNTWLGLEDVEDLDALVGLTGLPVEQVSMSLHRQPVRLGRVVASWPRLRTLRIGGQVADWSFADLHPDARLEDLDIEPAPPLAGLGRQRSLLRLALGYRWRPSGPQDWAELNRLERLEELTVSVEVLDDLADHVRLPSLKALVHYEEEDIDPRVEEKLTRAFPHAQLQMMPQVYDI